MRRGADDFDPRDCRILVFYAVSSFAEEPKPGTPSLVVDGLSGNPFAADVAPYLVEATLSDLAARLGRIEARPGLVPEDLRSLDRIRTWATGTGCEHFYLQLEPAAIAGDGTARRLGAEAHEERAALRQTTRRAPRKWIRDPTLHFLLALIGVPLLIMPLAVMGGPWTVFGVLGGLTLLTVLGLRAFRHEHRGHPGGFWSQLMVGLLTLSICLGLVTAWLWGMIALAVARSIAAW